MRAITGLDEDPLHRGYWAHRLAYDRGDLTGHAYWQKVGDDAGLVLTLDQVQSLIAADLDLWGQVNLPMLAWAQYLQRNGVTTGILSNIGDAMAEGLVARFDWLAHFNARTSSHALNLAKPERSPSTAMRRRIPSTPRHPISSSSTSAPKTSRPPSLAVCRASSTSITPPSSAI